MIDPQHLQEWRDSGVDNAIIELNVRSLSGYAPHERLLYSPKLERLNTGRVASWMLHRYAHTEEGGWWCSGLDPLDDWQSMQWGVFKPDCPRRDDDGKIRKYEHPPKEGTQAFFLRVNFKTSLKIARKYGLETKYWERFLPAHGTGEAESQREETKRKGFGISRKVVKCRHRNGTAILPRARRVASCSHQKWRLKRLEDKGFWQWVLQNKIPVCITEGVKKAGALLSAGFAAIALPGITSGYRQPKDEDGSSAGFKRLIPELEILKNHPIYFAFDHDEKRKTIRAVNNAIQKTGQLLSKQGCIISVIIWDSPQKGVDDFLVVNGVEAFEKCYGTAQPLEEWRSRSYSQLTYPVNVSLNQKYLGELNIPSDAKLIGIKAPKGSGKTESLAQIASDAAKDGRWVLILTHRVQLGQELCRRMGVPYVTEIKTSETGKLLGFGLCVDSLHPRSQAQFRAENWIGGTVVLDEAEQIVWHALNSTTCQSDRVPVLRELKTLITNALTSDTGRVILSDADLSDVTIDYVRDLAGVHTCPWIIENTWKPSGFNMHTYEDTTPAAMIGALEEHIRQGGKPFICCSAQKAKSRFGTRNLGAHLSRKFPDKKMLVIDSESISDPNHPAFNSTTRLNQILPQYDIVVTSPSLETGVSIDVKGHFTSVWGILQGVSPENSARQALARVREPVDRHIWAAPYGLGKVGNGATSIKSILASQHKLAKANIQLLKDADFEDLDTAFDTASLRAWAKMAVRVNTGMVRYRESVLNGLKAEGHRVVRRMWRFGSDTSDELTQTRNAEHQKEAEAIAASPEITQKEYEELQEKRSKTQQERYQERKHSLALRYGTDVTPDLVIKDDHDWHPQVRLHYYLTVGREHLPARDKKRVAAIKKQGEGAAWLPDLNKSVLGASIAALGSLGVLELLDTQREFKGSDADLQSMAQKAIACAWQVKAALGVSICEKDSPIAIAQKLLGKLGLRLTFLRKEGVRGKQQRVYGFRLPVDGRDEVFAAWLARDEAARLAELQNVSSCDTVVTPGNKEYLNHSADYQIPQPINEGRAADARQISDADVRDAARTLLCCDSPEAVKAVFQAISGFCQRAWEEVWALIPTDKEVQIWELALG